MKREKLLIFLPCFYLICIWKRDSFDFLTTNQILAPARSRTTKKKILPSRRLLAGRLLFFRYIAFIDAECANFVFIFICYVVFFLLSFPFFFYCVFNVALNFFFLFCLNCFTESNNNKTISSFGISFFFFFQYTNSLCFVYCLII